jgi:hypothetical protein
MIRLLRAIAPALMLMGCVAGYPVTGVSAQATPAATSVTRPVVADYAEVDPVYESARRIR